MMIRTIMHGSKDYEKMIALRVRALLAPIGVPASYIQKEKEKDDVLIGAFEGDDITGCCVLTPINDELVQLRQMVVDPLWQGKKIGAAIVQFAEQEAQHRGFTTLMMHARNPVIEFYSKCGYKVDGEEFFEVGIGHHRMMKKLSVNDQW
jgi:predicted GNAT family N-acyltransferase